MFIFITLSAYDLFCGHIEMEDPTRDDPFLYFIVSIILQQF